MRLALESGPLAAEISPFGAELVRLRHSVFGDLLWPGDPKWWDRQSPLLFPVVGRSVGDHVTIDGQSLPMPLHGFAHSLDFTVTASASDRALLTLADSAATRAHYPFAFRLDVAYRLADGTLAIEATATNDDSRPMPASFGFHPGFVWPLPGRTEKSGHSLCFDADTALHVARASNGLMLPQEQTLSLPEGVLPLEEALFSAGAMVMRAPASRGLRFSAPGASCVIRLDWEGLPSLGLWMRPGAPFLCIEPWAGEPDPQGFDGPLSARPGIAMLQPGESRSWRLAITAEAASLPA